MLTAQDSWSSLELLTKDSELPFLGYLLHSVAYRKKVVSRLYVCVFSLTIWHSSYVSSLASSHCILLLPLISSHSSHFL